MGKSRVVVLLSLLLVIRCQSPQVPDKSADVAIYSDEGTDEDCVQATKNMFQWMGYTVTLVNANYIRNGALHNCSILCVPGGDMYQYAQELSSDGIKKIKTFVYTGGGYIGICGGAYFAGEEVIWRGNQLPMTSLGLFSGRTEGPIDEIIPYPRYGMCKVNIVDTVHSITESEPDSMWILYYWGPILVPNGDGSIDILGRYDEVDQPAIVAFDYGYGRTVLIGTHPEFEEDSDRDGVAFADEFDDRGSDWGLMKKAALWCLRSGE